jgi:hypothetical protein
MQGTLPSSQWGNSGAEGILNVDESPLRAHYQIDQDW